MAYKHCILLGYLNKSGRVRQKLGAELAEIFTVSNSCGSHPARNVSPNIWTITEIRTEDRRDLLGHSVQSIRLKKITNTDTFESLALIADAIKFYRWA